MSSQPIVQWNCIIYFHIRVLFLTTFCTIFVHQYTRFVCFHRWFRRYDYISTNKVLLYYWKNIFYSKVLILYISTLSSLLFLFTVSSRYKSDYLHASIDILFFIMFWNIRILTRWRNIKLLYTKFVFAIQKRFRFEPDTPSPPPLSPVHYL